MILSEKQLPESVRPFVYGLYATTFGVDVSEAESSNLKDYPSLGHFFARFVYLLLEINGYLSKKYI